MRKKLLSFGLAIALSGLVIVTFPRPVAATPGQPGIPQAGTAKSPLTNDEVIRMLQSIMTSIRSSPVKFDLSPAGIAALRRAGASEEIIASMVQQQRLAQATGGNPGQPAGAVPGKPGATPTPQGQKGTLTAKVRNTAPLLGPVVTNPAATQSNAALIGLLRQQKQTALNAGRQTTPPSGSLPSPTYARASAARTALPTPTPPPPSGNSLSNRAVLGSRASVSVACGTFNSPMIQSVSGQSGGTAVFTQDPAYNPFIIEGCNFGNTPGRAQLNFPDGRKLANMKIYSWSANAITVEVDPALVDVLDQNNITLVLVPATGPQTQKSGFKFYAMRREFLLNNIPAGQVYLAPVKDAAGNLVAPHYSSPIKGASAEVQRGNVVRFSGGTDQFNFARLKPGFVIEKYQVSEGNYIYCDSEGGQVPDETFYTDGTWGWRISGNAIQVSWQEKHEHCTGAWGNTADGSIASYGLNVWVVGPALSPGASPWQ
jgi:hypothetical protein